jgi:hypothetical protein
MTGPATTYNVALGFSAGWRTKLVQTARTSIKSRGFVGETGLFHKVFHSFCEERVNARQGCDLNKSGAPMIAGAAEKRSECR